MSDGDQAMAEDFPPFPQFPCFPITKQDDLDQKEEPVLEYNIQQHRWSITSQKSTLGFTQQCPQIYCTPEHECVCRICDRIFKPHSQNQTALAPAPLWMEEEDEILSIAKFVGSKTNNGGFQDVLGLEEVKEFLRQAIIYPMKYPHLFHGVEKRQPWSRALLFGAPGVGKTALMYAMAKEADAPLYHVSSADLTSAWSGETEKNIRKLFQTLGNTRCVLVLDEVDALCRKRNSKDSTHSRRATNELLIHVDRYEGSPMFLLCATNCPWDIDDAFFRRFQKSIYVPLPDRETRKQIILKSISDDPKILESIFNDQGWDSFIDETEGLTGCDLKNMVRNALMIPIGEMDRSKYWKKSKEGLLFPADSLDFDSINRSIHELDVRKVRCRSLRLSDLQTSLSGTDRTVTEDCLKPLEAFIKNRRIK